MNIFDIIVIAVLAFMTLRGGMKGMVSQIVSIGSYFICWIVASRFACAVAPSIPAQEPWNQIGAMLVLFLGTMIAIRFIHSRIEKSLESMQLKEFNRQTGALLGFGKGLLVCMVLTFFGVMLSEQTRTTVFTSKSGRYLAYMIEKTGAFIPADTCKMLSSQIALFEAELKNGPQSMQFPTSSTAAGNGADPTQSLWSAGAGLLDEAKALRDKWNTHSGSSESLLDAIGKWWNGEKNTYSKDGSSTLQQLENQAVSAFTQLTGSTAKGITAGQSTSLQQTFQNLENQATSAIRDELNAFATSQRNPSQSRTAARQPVSNTPPSLQQTTQNLENRAAAALESSGISIPRDLDPNSPEARQTAQNIGRQAADALTKEIGSWANDPQTQQELKNIGNQVASTLNKDLSNIANNPQMQQELQDYGRQAASALNKELSGLANDPRTQQAVQDLENKTADALRQSFRELGQELPQQGGTNPFLAQQAVQQTPNASMNTVPSSSRPAGRFLMRRTTDHPLRTPDNLLNAARESQTSGKAAALFSPERRPAPVQWDPQSWANSLSNPQ